MNMNYNFFENYNMGNRDYKKERINENLISSILLSGVNKPKETRVKKVSFTILRDVKAQHSQLSHMN